MSGPCPSKPGYSRSTRHRPARRPPHGEVQVTEADQAESELRLEALKALFLTLDDLAMQHVVVATAPITCSPEPDEHTAQATRAWLRKCVLACDILGGGLDRHFDEVATQRDVEPEQPPRVN